MSRSITALVAFAGCILSSYAAKAELLCELNGPWTIVHQNGVRAKMKMTLNGFNLKGNGGTGTTQNGKEVTGTVDENSSHVQGRDVRFTIDWTSNHSGRYVGTVRAATKTTDAKGLPITIGRVRGKNFDLHDPSIQQPWFTEESFVCRP
jgi:hypothetical protein